MQVNTPTINPNWWSVRKMESLLSWQETEEVCPWRLRKVNRLFNPDTQLSSLLAYWGEGQSKKIGGKTFKNSWKEMVLFQKFFISLIDRWACLIIDSDKFFCYACRPSVFVSSLVWVYIILPGWLMFNNMCAIVPLVLGLFCLEIQNS